MENAGASEAGARCLAKLGTEQERNREKVFCDSKIVVRVPSPLSILGSLSPFQDEFENSICFAVPEPQLLRYYFTNREKTRKTIVGGHTCSQKRDIFRVRFAFAYQEQLWMFSAI